MNANDAVRTDWTQDAPWYRDLPGRGYQETTATIPCGLLRSTGRPCPERFFNEYGRELHLAEDHGCGIASIVEAPPAGTEAGAEAQGNRGESLARVEAPAASTPPRKPRVMWYHKEVAE